MTGFRLELDQGAINALVTRYADAALERAATVTQGRARANLSAAGRNNTGALSQSIQATRDIRGQRWTVGSNLPYAIYQEEGVEGPIYPKRAKVLRFKPKGSAVFIFRPVVSGFRGVHYLRDAVRSLGPSDFVP